MLYAIFSDVHDNVAALERTLTHLQARGADAYLQLGDLGPASLPLLDDLPVRHVFGNWEVSQIGLFPASRQAQIAAWPAHLTGSTWTASHASPVFPAECDTLAATRHYMTARRPGWLQLFPSLLYSEKAVWAALAELEAQDRLVAFHGHTHVQAVQRLTAANRLEQVEGPEISLTPGTRTLVGVGSVGSPRDGDAPRCVLWDDEAMQVELVQIRATRGWIHSNE